MADKINNIIFAGILLACLIFVLYRKDQEIESLRDEINRNRQLSEEVKRRLNELLNSDIELDEKISQELLLIIPLLEIEQETKAIFSLAKIIENLLKELYRNDEDLQSKFQNKKNGPSFNDYLEHAKENKVVTPEDYHLISILRIIRNEEAHELNVKKEGSRVAAAFTAGLSLVFKLTFLIKDSMNS